MAEYAEARRAWPRNVWAGTTVEDQRRAEERIPELLRIGARVELVNEDSIDVVRALAGMRTPEQLLQAMEAVGEARERINLNVAPLLALEAMTISVMAGVTSA